jgi:transposase, IS605 orfB family
MTQVYCYETELKPSHNSDIIEYFEQYRTKFNEIVRFTWQYYNNQDPLIAQKSKLNTLMQNKFHISTRGANSIISYVAGKYRSLLELKKTELRNFQSEISELKKDIAELSIKVNNLSRKAANNKLNDKQLKKYRYLKNRLVAMKKRLDRRNNAIPKIEKQIETKKLSLCFGSKALFAHQRLETNHLSWYMDFIEARDSFIYYVGRREETHCNSQCQLFYDKKHNSFKIQLRKEDDHQVNNKDKHVYGQCYFRYGNKEIQETLSLKNSPISYRILKRDNRYFLQAIITVEKTDVRQEDNVIGVDFNKGFVALSEVKKDGNLVNTNKTYYRFRKGNGSKNDLRVLADVLAKRCISNNASLAIEDLNFVKKRTKAMKHKKDKKINEMLHSLAYSSFSEFIKRACFKNNIHLSLVNPAYTSIIGKEKYSEVKKLNVHTAASYVIGRRALNFIDNRPV